MNSLPVDKIVAKYGSLGTEEGMIDSLRMRGFSDAQIAKLKARPRSIYRIRLAAIEAGERSATKEDKRKKAEQVESFRTRLLAMTRVEQVNEYLSLFNSEERIGALWHATLGEPDEIFWPLFVGNWSVCDDTWYFSKVLLDTLRSRAASAVMYLSEEQRAFRNSLPELIAVFRGCSRARVRGLSWTTDRAVAEGFARGHRGLSPPDPIVAEALIPKPHTFLATDDRGEAEVVLDPKRLRSLRVQGWPLANRTAA